MVCGSSGQSEKENYTWIDHYDFSQVRNCEWQYVVMASRRENENSHAMNKFNETNQKNTWFSESRKCARFWNGKTAKSFTKGTND